MMKSNICIYYGAIVKISDLNNIIGKKTLDELYVFFVKNNLNYRILGEYRNSGKLVVGKEIACESLNNALEINPDGELPLLHYLSGKSINVKIANEYELQRKLISLGIIEPLHYYVVNSFDTEG